MGVTDPHLLQQVVHHRGVVVAMATPQDRFICLTPVRCSTKTKTGGWGAQSRHVNYKYHQEVQNSVRQLGVIPVVFRQLVAGDNTEFDVIHTGRECGLLEGYCDFLLVAVDILNRS